MKKILGVLLVATFLSSCTNRPYIYGTEEEVPEEPVYYTQPRVISMPLEGTSPATVAQQEVAQPPKNEVLVEKRENYQPYTNLQASDLQAQITSPDVQIKQEATGVNIIMPASVLFGTNLTTVQPSFEPDLAAIATQIKENGRMMVQVRGFADGTGSVLGNRDLSLRWAKAVSNFLQLHGVSYERIYLAGLGSQDPVAPNDTAFGRMQNNRVEIRLISIQ